MNEELKKAICEAVKAQQEGCKCDFSIPEVELEHPSNNKFGDLSTNIAMKIGKQQGENPFTIAENLVKQFDSGLGQNDVKGMIKKIEAVKPGFINFYLSNDFFAANIKEILAKKDSFGKSDIGKDQVVVLDYSHPNIAKPIGVHHLITTLIGESIKRTYGFIGAKTIADNFLGDWGTQFGKTIYAFKEWGDRKEVEKDPINELLKLYVRFHEEADKSPELDEKGREEFKKLEEGDKENTELWKWMREESIKELKSVYKRLDVSFDYYNGEAFYNDKTGQIIDALDKKGILETGEGGAKIVDLEKDDLRIALIQKGDGATLYLTRDLAAIKYRTENFKPTQILYVVENAQGLHLAQAFKIAEMADLKNDTELVHVKFGSMRFPEGRMSTRKGKVVFLWDVLEKAKEKALKIVEEKNPDLENKAEVAEIVGVGAVKYAILSHNRVTDISFTWEKILSLDGNSAPYLMYTYARAKSILRKAGEAPKDFKIQSLEKEEESLLKKIYQFSEIVEVAAREYAPSHIATYAYELAQDFNTFYNKVPVLNADKDLKEFRLALVSATSQIIKNSMNLLSIDLPKKM
ncbi:MAG: arginine--tRNA ligase [bacterium]|nr:arginine--tRNA ligase [bacterium]